MMWKNWRSLSFNLAIIVLTSLAGLTTSGCISVQASKQQIDNRASNHQASTANPQPHSLQANTQQINTQQAPNTRQFGLQENMPYAQARSLLIQQGWQPHLQGDPPNLNNPPVKALFDLGYPEVKDCAGTGLGPCRFEFINDGGELLVVSAIEGSDNQRVVWRWFIEERTNPNPQNSSSNYTEELPFVGTRFFNFWGGNGTGQSIAIAADGTTTITLHGSVSSSVQYRGQFSNPIILEEGYSLLLRDGKIYLLSTNGQIAQGCNGDANPCESGLYEPSSSAIADGFYVLGGTDQGLEVVGEQYRYYDELGTQAWQPISELTFISDGVVFDGTSYWCIPSSQEAGVCTEKGWSSAR